MLPLTPLISKNLLKLLVLLLLTGFVNAQTVVSGTVVDENNSPLEGVTVSAETVEVVTNRSGKYSIKAPTDKEDIIVYFIFEGKEDFSKVIEKGSPARVSLDVRLSPTGTGVDLGEVVFQGKRNVAIGSVEISPQDIITQPTLTGSFTDILKTLPYVNSNTELSSQYMVRGGNYDENLVYLNGIEVYRPQLIRSGKQEGLNFLNPSMAAAVTFSPGGWEAKYGDKMSSSLDVIYKRPKEFSLESELSLMGANVTVGTATKDGKFSALVGGRYMNRNLILETLDGDTEFNPQSYDIQTSLTYDIGKKWKLNALGNFSRTLFEQEPHDRTTKFGTLQNPISLKVFYNGKEEYVFQT